MNWNYQELLPADFDPGSKVWIYQANRVFALSEALMIEAKLEDFISAWQAHGAKVKGYANLFFGQFIVLIADETKTGVSGCSTDSSVRVIKEIEQLTGVSLFDRQLLAFVIKDKVQVLPLAQLNYSVENGYIDAQTIYFNNLVATKAELETNWMQPLQNSWLARRVQLPEGKI